MERFLEVYQHLNRNNLETLAEIYSDDIVFIDPAHTLNGLTQLREYFEKLYSGLDSIKFDFIDHQQQNDVAYVQWRMDMHHSRLRRGRLVSVEGVSRLEFDTKQKVKLHRDYFDLGEMLYENLPIIGRVILSIKKRLGQ
ncbi:nuclear transport factor 2 family protein [Desulfopila inferna]|mgnify:CR=1 FL=1|uniref:nuclear transport factor 2 family protein n=1 Tax=Desulfopila inferna TaxID=468528 RepID=UPI0019667476|nr:nuclear transport factor 2 family protein [Desulfopila inferna]MBM9605319.1 nuclear transport factor 2 family protein [Desulfopila inferna]